jgi:hypothetical protein
MARHVELNAYRIQLPTGADPDTFERSVVDGMFVRWGQGPWHPGEVFIRSLYRSADSESAGDYLCLVDLSIIDVERRGSLADLKELSRTATVKPSSWQRVSSIPADSRHRPDQLLLITVEVPTGQWALVEEALTRIVTAAMEEPSTRMTFDHVEFADLLRSRGGDGRDTLLCRAMGHRVAVPEALSEIASMPGVTLVSERFELVGSADGFSSPEPTLPHFEITAMVNADFANLPIDAVDLEIDYPPETALTGHPTVLPFRTAGDPARFASFVDSDEREYRYRYVVHYVDDPRTYAGAWITTDDRLLAVAVHDAGIVDVEIAADGVDYRWTTRVDIALRHPSTAPGVPLERVVPFHDGTPPQRVRAIAAAPMQPYDVTVTHYLTDGHSYQYTVAGAAGPKFFVPNPFPEIRTISVRSFGDLGGRIREIFLNLCFEDKKHGFTQTTAVSLTGDAPSFDWRFPVPDSDVGAAGYTGHIRFSNGDVRPIPDTPIIGRTVLVGDVVHESPVNIVPDLVDWSATRLVKIVLRHDEPDLTDSVARVFTRDRLDQQTWLMPYRKHRSFSWTAEYHHDDGSSKIVGQQSVTDGFVVLPASDEQPVPANGR